MLKISVKTFDELTKNELYDLLQLRSEVFVVEQNCVYQDLDGKDQKAFHVIGTKNNKIVAYTRIFDVDYYLDQASIGRVVVKVLVRKDGYGVDIMKASIKAIQDKFNETTIALSAQVYLKRFYNSLGFTEVGAEYLEDDIPHVLMVKN